MAGADSHDLWCRLSLRDELAGLDIAQRVERLRDRFAQVEGLLGEARNVLPGRRFLSARTVRMLAATLDLLGETGALAPMGPLRHPA